MPRWHRSERTSSSRTTEDDHAGSCPSAARSRCGSCSRPGGGCLQQLAPPAPAPPPRPRKPPAFPVTITSFAGQVHVPVRPGAIVSLVADGHGDALRDRRRRPGQSRRRRLGLPGESRPSRNCPATPRTPRRSPRTSPTSWSSPTTSRASRPSCSRCRCPCSTLPAALNLQQVYTEFDRAGPGDRAPAAGPAGSHQLKAAVSKIVAAEPSRTTPLSYYYEVSTDPYYSATSSTFIGSVLSLLGLKSIADAAKGAAAAGGYPTLSLGVHPQVQSGLHHPDRHRADRRRPVGGHGEPPARLVSADRGQGQGHHQPEPRRRLALGPARRADLLQDVAKALAQGSQ